MIEDQWDRVGEIFEQAMPMAAGDRFGFLEEACGGDADLRAQLDTLLAAAADANEVLQGLARRAGLPEPGREDATTTASDELADPNPHSPASDPDPRSPDLTGTQIGAHRIVKEIGRGGMGVVYLAERADEDFEQRVALKLIKRGMDSNQILDRFLRERRILARLEHPGIARLYHGGISDDDRPYFVMEYVDGVPLTDFADNHRLGIEARLELFMVVCDAVQYAHRSLVVHRDLKPSNILVTEGRAVKLLDFGVGKLLDEEDSEVLTRTGMRVFTPAYAAPEQLRGEPVTTATDVYALGVVLYQLLTGRRPFDGPRREDAEPERPSTVTAGAQDAAELRGTTPDRLRQRLVGDLDTICLMALRPEPARRYATVEALGEDVRRAVTGLPVMAHPESPGYRARKFVARNRAASAGAGIAVAALLLGLGGTLWQAREARSQRDAAQREAHTANQVVDFVGSVFAGSNPFESGERDVTARELLEEGSGRIEGELADQPEVRARLLQVMGTAFQGLGLYDEARNHLDRSLALREELFGESDPEMGDGRQALGQLMLRQSEHDEAAVHFEAALAQRRAAFGENDIRVARSLWGLGSAYMELGRLDEAEVLHRESVDIRRRVLEEGDTELADGLAALGIPLMVLGKFEQADSAYGEAIDLYRATDGPTHPRLAETLDLRAIAFGMQDRFAQSEPLFREALEVRRAVLGDRHPMVANSLGNYAVLLSNMGRLEESVAAQTEAISIDEEAYGLDHPDVGRRKHNLGSALRDLGRYEEAEPLYRAGLAAALEVYGPDHQRTANSYSGLGAVAFEQGDQETAIPLLREALRTYRAGLPEGHQQRGAGLNDLARALQAAGDMAGADTLFAQAQAILEVSFPDGHSWTINSLVGVGEVRMATGHLADAEVPLQKAVEMADRVLTPGDRGGGMARSALGACLWALGRDEEAEPYLRAGWEELVAAAPAVHIEHLKARDRLAEFYEATGRPDEARVVRAGGGSAG